MGNTGMADNDKDLRCRSINPKSTAPDDRCQRPAGHAGDHIGYGHSGRISIYPSKWTDDDTAEQA